MSSTEPKTQPANIPPELSDLHCYTETDGVVTATTFEIEGYRIKRSMGVVYGITVRSRNWAASMGMVLKSVVSGELKWFTNMLYSARNDAISRVVSEAKSRGANGLVGLRFESGSMEGFAQTTAYATAVVLEKVDESVETPPQLLG